MKLIRSRDNPLFKQLRRLAESGRERRKAGKTLLEGMHLVGAHEQVIGPVDTLVIGESVAPDTEIGAYVVGRDVVILSDALLGELGLVDRPSGLLAIVDIPSNIAVANPKTDAILLDGVQDPGNLGTLLRTAAAAGIGQALLGPACAAAWSPKVLRAGQGAHFVLNILEDADLADFIAGYRGKTVATSLGTDAPSLYAADLLGPLAWIFGSEGQGVRPELQSAATLRLRIPMPGAVESLNVGAAAAACLFEMVRQRAR